MGFLNSLIVRIKGDNSDIKKKLGDTEKSMNGFMGTVKRVGAAIGVAFAVEKIISFSKEAMHLSATLEGVSSAFAKLNNPSLLNNLRTATRGTVSDLVLMQKAVQANNFKIPLGQLATYFEFATKRAIETGQSVDYMVDSLITGVGRKSVLVMDNLGISAVELQEEVRKVGDFGEAAGNIIRRELTSMGDVASTTATKMQQISASTENIKTAWGEMINTSRVVQKAMGDTASTFENMTERMRLRAQKKDDPFLTWYQRAFMTVDDYKRLLDEVAKRQAKLKSQSDSLYKNFGVGGTTDASVEKTKEEVRTIASLNEELAGLQDFLETINIEDTKSIRITNDKIKAIQEQIKTLKELSSVTRASNPSISPVSGGGVPGGSVSGSLYVPGMEMAQSFTQGMNDWMTQEAIMQVQSWQGILQSAFMDLANVVGDSMAQIFEGIGSGNLEGVFGDIIGSFGSFIANIGKMLVAYGGAMLAFSILSKSPDPISAGAAIAAGLAAIAIGSMIKGAASKGSSAISGGGFSSGSAQGIQAQQLTIQVEGILKGSDIQIVSRRYNDKVGKVT